MGLDVRFLKNARHLDVGPDGSWEEAEELAPPGSYVDRAYNISGFEDRFDGMEHGFWAGESFNPLYGSRRGLSFSYGGYNVFRELLCRAALGVTAEEFWDDEDPDKLAKPFGPMIQFADNEGAIGTKTCGRLADDFVANRERVIKAWEEMDALLLNSYTVEELTARYDAFALGFREMAINDGIALWR